MLGVNEDDASGQNHGRALLAQPYGEYPAAVLRWGAEEAVTDGAPVFFYLVKSERLGSAKMSAETSSM